MAAGGGATSFGAYTVAGGGGGEYGQSSLPGSGGVGGGIHGAFGQLPSNLNVVRIAPSGTIEVRPFFGGGQGGSGGNGGGGRGSNGATAPGYLGGAGTPSNGDLAGGGGGGAASYYGSGANATTSTGGSASATAYGAGGAGGHSFAFAQIGWRRGRWLRDGDVGGALMAFKLPSPPPPQHMVDADTVVDTSWHQWFTMLWQSLRDLYAQVAAIPAASTDNGMTPYFIPENSIFTVPINKQAFWSMTIDNEGLLIVDGFLIQVDGY